MTTIPAHTPTWEFTPAKPIAPLTAADKRFFRRIAALFVGGLIAVGMAAAATYYITFWMYAPTVS